MCLKLSLHQNNKCFYTFYINRVFHHAWKSCIIIQLILLQNSRATHTNSSITQFDKWPVGAVRRVVLVLLLHGVTGPGSNSPLQEFDVFIIVPLARKKSLRKSNDLYVENYCFCCYKNWTEDAIFRYIIQLASLIILLAPVGYLTAQYRCTKSLSIDAKKRLLLTARFYPRIVLVGIRRSW